jgi:nucleoside 2-deoxyribosyltransferase
MEKSKIKECFVLIPFKKQFSDVYDLVIKSLENEFNLIVKKADELPFQINWNSLTTLSQNKSNTKDVLEYRARSIYEQIIASIESSDFIIADLSGMNPNVLYELGYAHASKKIVIQITQDHLPFDVAGFRTLFYNNNELKKLKEVLQSTVKELVDHIDNKRKEQMEDPWVLKHQEVIEAVLKYAKDRGIKCNWNSRGLFFTEELLIKESGVDENIANKILMTLKEQGLLYSLLIKDEIVWQASDKLYELST